MDGVGVVLHLWNEWAVQILVLLSFSLQVFLFFFAGTRRRNKSTVLTVLLWLAYQLADSTATYTLGHLSIASSQHEHHLVAFWAPFLLLHLGGQDTITAYALEDNRLWLRHLQTFVVQVLGVAYVLYKYVSGSGKLVAASILMFALGGIKFGERIWALKCANSVGLSSFLKNYCEKTYGRQEFKAPHDLEQFGTEEELVIHGGHTLLGLCLRLFLDHTPGTGYYEQGVIAYLVGNKKILRVIEMELFLMYDIIYTKARVIHTCYGRFIRVVLVVTIIATLVLFPSVDFKDGYNRVDVAISYILLVGAVILEMASLFITVVSTWACHYMYMNKYHRLLPKIVFLRGLVKADKIWRRQRCTIGQLDMLECCLGGFSVSGNLSKINIKFSPPVQVSAHLEDSMLIEILRIAERYDGLEARMNLLNMTSELHVFDGDFNSRVIIWHVATVVILSSIRGNGEHVKAIETLSNYMLFLLAKHPEMLPGPSRPPVFASSLLWVGSILIGRRCRAELAQNVLKEGQKEDNPSFLEKSPCKIGAELAIALLDKERDSHHHLLETLFAVWVEMLCYAGSHCSRDSHARNLSTGGEFLTVVWLLTRHISEYARFKRGDRRY